MAFSLLEGRGVTKDREGLSSCCDTRLTEATACPVELAFQLGNGSGSDATTYSSVYVVPIAARMANNPEVRERAIQGQNRLIIRFSSQQIIATPNAARTGSLSARDWNLALWERAPHRTQAIIVKLTRLIHDVSGIWVGGCSVSF